MSISFQNENIISFFGIFLGNIKISVIFKNYNYFFQLISKSFCVDISTNTVDCSVYEIQLNIIENQKQILDENCRQTAEIKTELLNTLKEPQKKLIELDIDKLENSLDCNEFDFIEYFQCHIDRVS